MNKKTDDVVAVNRGNKKTKAIVISSILFFIALGFIIAVCMPYFMNTASYDETNTFAHSATVNDVVTYNNRLEIRLIENEKILYVNNGMLDGKTDLLNTISAGDKIEFRCGWEDYYSSPYHALIEMCAFSINDTPILTLEESTKRQTRVITILTIMAVIFASVLISIGVLLLVRVFKKPKCTTMIKDAIVVDEENV